MLPLKTIVAALTAAITTTATTTVAAPTSSPWRDFSGLGQIRMLHNAGDHEDLGCLTSAGGWTTDEARCGVFRAARTAEHAIRLHALRAGVCGVETATFRCGDGVREIIFGVYPLSTSLRLSGSFFSLLKLAYHLIIYPSTVCLIWSKTETNGALPQTWGEGVPVAGREVLRYSQYGVVATHGISPPAPDEEPLEIHFFTGIEKGKWAWMGWKPLGTEKEDY